MYEGYGCIRARSIRCFERLSEADGVGTAGAEACVWPGRRTNGSMRRRVVERRFQAHTSFSGGGEHVVCSVLTSTRGMGRCSIRPIASTRHEFYSDKWVRI